MKKRLVAIMISGLMASTMLAACGGSKAADTASSSAASAVSESSVEETADTSEETVADTSEGTEAVADTSVEASSESSSDISFVDGYYANDGNGHDFMIAFYENAPGDVAYVSDGTNEAFAEYTAENATTDDGTDYILITVGQLQMGYIADQDGTPYLVDLSDGTLYTAAALTEEEADAIYQAVKGADNATADAEAKDATDVKYVDGYYANDGNGHDFMIAFYTTSNGDFAYVNDGQTEAVAPYTVSDATTDDGVAYTLVSVGETVLGYYTDDSGNIYIVDEDGTVYAGGALSEEEADQLYEIVVNQQ